MFGKNPISGSFYQKIKFFNSLSESDLNSSQQVLWLISSHSYEWGISEKIHFPGLLPKWFGGNISSVVKRSGPAVLLVFLLFSKILKYFNFIS
jgi:hypothetical protein